MRRFNRTSSIVVAMTMALGLLIQASTAPAAVTAKVPAVSISVTPFPNNATSSTAAFVTAGKYVAFDVAVRNNGHANVVKVNLDDALTSSGGGEATYMGALVMGGSVAGQTACAAPDPAHHGEFSCSAGNLRSGADLSLRVIYLTPSQPGTLDVTFCGTSSGNHGSRNGRSHGDCFIGETSVDLVTNFANGGDFRTSGYVPPQGDDLQTNLAGFGPTNPMWTHITISPASIGNQVFGTTASIAEADSFDVICPVEDEGEYSAYWESEPPEPACFGQTSRITLADGATLAAPFRVEIRVDNARHFTSLENWTIIHVFDDTTSYEVIDQGCVMSAGTPTNAPCLESKHKAADDYHDYVAVLWLTRNGYIRNG